MKTPRNMSAALLLLAALTSACSLCYNRRDGFQAQVFCSLARMDKNYDKTGLTSVSGTSASSIPWDTDKGIDQQMRGDTSGTVTDSMTMQLRERSGEQTVAIVRAVIDAAVKAAASAPTGAK